MTPAVFFDMDMTLINSRPCLKEAINNFFLPRGADVYQIDYDRYIGMDETVIFRLLAKTAGIEYTDDIGRWIFDEFSRLAPSRVRAFDGVHELIGRLRADGYYVVISTSTYRTKMEANMAAAGVDLAQFDDLIYRDIVPNGKPAPDIYLTAWERSGREKGDCLVVEDAINGIRSAKAAGLKCLCVEYSFKKDVLLEAGANYVVHEAADLYDSIRHILPIER